ncbi:hypothetical protein SAMN04487948_1307 [Halogranum amylolyticum]|uniref:Uncharacterized protein n=1 Tax=Halogranum amylolyticum TaxID=660520 RepID=A0A1H8WIY8_9EURY|nr:hypothetical protein [Halogranum amylolyticum]SEP27048.1 hypothetical protein SAMN04487948_1307 [Halogranum amylolyticum]
MYDTWGMNTHAILWEKVTDCLREASKAVRIRVRHSLRVVTKTEGGVFDVHALVFESGDECFHFVATEFIFTLKFCDSVPNLRDIVNLALDMTCDVGGDDPIAVDDRRPVPASTPPSATADVTATRRRNDSSRYRKWRLESRRAEPRAQLNVSEDT